jgi:hypothetical protein
MRGRTIAACRNITSSDHPGSVTEDRRHCSGGAAAPHQTNQITAENTELRETLKMAPANVVPLVSAQVPVQRQARPDAQSDDRRP